MHLFCILIYFHVISSITAKQLPEIRAHTNQTETEEVVEYYNKEASRLYAELLLCVCWHTILL